MHWWHGKVVREDQHEAIVKDFYLCLKVCLTLARVMYQLKLGVLIDKTSFIYLVFFLCQAKILV